jgi:hypothetical protein
MQRVADWLKKLGMSEYAERFAENDIDVAVLPAITAAARNWSSAMVVSSPNICATAFSLISATRKRMSMMPSARFAPVIGARLELDLVEVVTQRRPSEKYTLEVAKRQRLKLWELRAATSLARLWRDRGKRAESP